MVFLDQLARHLAQPGFAPMPMAPGSPEMVRIPVRIALCKPGESDPFAVVDAVALIAHPHRGSIPDKVTGELSPEKPAVCVLTCELPRELFPDLPPVEESKPPPPIPEAEFQVPQLTAGGGWGRTRREKDAATQGRNAGEVP